MSKKHEQRSRAQILAKRNTEHPAQVTVGISRFARRVVTTTAAARRVMRSKYKPHEGRKQQVKAQVRTAFASLAA